MLQEAIQEIIDLIESKYKGKDGTGGAAGKDARNIEFKIEDGKLQCRHEGSFWRVLLHIDGLKGKDGVDGIKGNDGLEGKAGADGKPGLDGVKGSDGKDGADGKDGKDATLVELRIFKGYIQWRSGGEWEDLILLERLRGQDGVGLIGPQGPQGLRGATGPAGTTVHSLLSDLNLNDHNQYLLTDCSNDPLTGALDLPELYNSLGSLKIMPDAQGNVDLFGDTDVANGADGKIFSVTRRAAEGDTTISIFGNDDQWAHICADWDISIYSNVAAGVIEIGRVSTNIVRLIGDNYNSIGEPNGTKNLLFRHYGYITAGGLSAQKYVQWQVDDADDYFWLTRQSDSIKGFKIDMPVDLIDNNLTTTGTIISGSRIGHITTVTDTYTVLVTDETVICDKVTAFTVTLPVGVVGQKFAIKNINIGSVTVEGDGTDTIDGQANVVLSQWDSVQLQCYVAKWGII